MSSPVPDCLSLERKVCFPGVESHSEVTAVLHAGQLGFIAVDRRRQVATRKLLIAINLNRGL